MSLLFFNGWCSISTQLCTRWFWIWCIPEMWPSGEVGMLKLPTKKSSLRHPDVGEALVKHRCSNINISIGFRYYFSHSQTLPFPSSGLLSMQVRVIGPLWSCSAISVSFFWFIFWPLKVPQHAFFRLDIPEKYITALGANVDCGHGVVQAELDRRGLVLKNRPDRTWLTPCCIYTNI